jgi:alpha-amylase/alpha-mannosidase (GH57 family)
MASRQRYLCIHGHFYQPPRENPWLEAIELQDSARPFHDWNERITAECYAPNSAARIQDHEGHILGIINNYARISYNFGPTLLSWMEQYATDVYEAIINADKESAERFGGHGSALAQVYNHIIMPLANARDKRTQVIWGIRDFEERFRRRPEGMWLAEAAVDTETLELMAEQGIKFTVLAPGQASKVRPLAANGRDVPDVGWEDVNGARIDPARAYYCALPSGRAIAIFFYDGPISQSVAFEGLLRSGEGFASRLLSGFSEHRDYAQLLHISTDGETYGHHHKFGDMALAYALHYIETNHLARLTNYGEYLELHPPTWEVRIHENSSWSCAHGVERWRSHCGCNTGRAGWNQVWRGPLREALDWLRDSVLPHFERSAAALFRDPWAARDAYVQVILDRSHQSVQRFLDSQASVRLDEALTTRALKLMELQRQAMLMYTSCGWFFDELSGIETVQVMNYAGRVVQLAEELFGAQLEEGFKQRLEKAKSNIPEYSDGRCIYERFVKPSFVDLSRVGAHYAVSSLFHAAGERSQIYAFNVEREDVRLFEAGHARLAVGKARIESIVTHEIGRFTYAVLHFGDHNLTAGVRTSVSELKYEQFVNEASAAFLRADLPEVIRILDRQFYGLTFSLASLFKDEQRKILDEILRSTLEQASATLRLVFEHHAPLMNFLGGLGVPQPQVLRSAGQFVLGAELRDLIERGVKDSARVRALLADAKLWNLPLDSEGVEASLSSAIKDRAEAWREEPESTEPMESLLVLVDVAREMPFQVNFWRAQNVLHDVLKKEEPIMRRRAASGDLRAKDWLEIFERLASGVKVKINNGH